MDPYRQLFEQSADALFILDDGAFVECNQAAVELFRFESRDDALAAHPSQISPEKQPDGEDSFEKANRMIAIALDQGSHRFEWAHQRADGDVFPAEVLLTAVQLEGRIVLHSVVRDVTDRRRLEEQLRHAQRMEAVGKLAGGIAHDFNNLLVVILGNAELLSDVVPEGTDAGEYVAAIRESGESAAALVGQLLAFGRKQPRRLEVVDLSALVDRMRRMLSRLIGADLAFTALLHPEPIPVRVDPGQMERVVMNLVSNARDASPEGGTLTIETSRTVLDDEEAAEAGVAAPGSYAALSVSDTGVGMARGTMERAFDPFFTTKDPGRGTGLGLSTVYSIVEQCGGSVRLESVLGHGTTVRILLPLFLEDPDGG